MIESVTHKYVKVICIDNLHADVSFSLSLSVPLSIRLYLSPSFLPLILTPSFNPTSLSLLITCSLSLSAILFCILCFF